MVRSHEHLKSVSVSTRLYAFLWDYIIILGYLFLLTGVSLLFNPLLIPLFTASPLSAEITGFVLITLPVFLYFAISEGSKSQATWGKRKMGILVADMRGQPIGPGNSLLRSAVKFFPWELAHFTIWHIVIPTGYSDTVIYSLFSIVYGLGFIYLISPLMNKNRRTLYDFIAGSVIRYKDS